MSQKKMHQHSHVEMPRICQAPLVGHSPVTISLSPGALVNLCDDGWKAQGPHGGYRRVAGVHFLELSHCHWFPLALSIPLLLLFLSPVLHIFSCSIAFFFDKVFHRPYRLKLNNDNVCLLSLLGELSANRCSVIIICL